MGDKLPRVALIVGAGLSKALGGYTTADIEGRFLETPKGGLPLVEEEITRQLRGFWLDTFGWGCGRTTPSLADHFTELDLAANAGHNLGRRFPPGSLRALRHLSLHRIFTVLGPEPSIPKWAQAGVDRLRSSAQLGMISLNWDQIAELAVGQRRLRFRPGGAFWGKQARGDGTVQVMKLHGSVDWGYCDTCRVITKGLGAGAPGHGHGLLLRQQDFQALKADKCVIRAVRAEADPQKDQGKIRCQGCRSRLSARVGTFSYRKDYAIGPYHGIWYSALRWLVMSGVWLFAGYSMPEADFEFRHILKTAQMAREEPPSITVVLGGDDQAARDAAAKRYRRFFGSALASPVYLDGWGAWCGEQLGSLLAWLGEPSR